MNPQLHSKLDPLHSPMDPQPHSKLDPLHSQINSPLSHDVSMDSESKDYISHLIDLALQRCEPDAALTDSFSQGLLYHKPSLISSDGESCNPAIKLILQLLFRMNCPVPQEYTDLLEKILRHLSLSQIFRQVPEDLIFYDISGPFMDVLESKTRTAPPSELVAFVEGKHLCNKLLDVLFEPYTLSQPAHKITSFFYTYYRNFPVPEPALFWQKWVQNADFSASKLVYSRPSSFFSYIDVLNSMRYCKVDQKTMEITLDFDPTQAFEDYNDGEFSIVVLVDFFAPYLKTYELGENSLKILKMLLARFKQYLESDTMPLLVVPAYNELLNAMLDSVSHRQHALRFLRINQPIVDIERPDGARIFREYDLALLKHPAAIFRSNFQNRAIHRVAYPIFDAMLHLISDPRFFKLLVESGNFSEKYINLLPRNLWYETLWELASYEHSVQYMFDNASFMPKLIGDEEVMNKKMTSTRRDIFCFLVENGGDVDMGVYRDTIHQMAEKFKND